MIFTFGYLTLNEAERLPGKATLTALSGHQRYNLAIKEKMTMNIVEFSVLTFLGSLTAGFLGALTGLGGGVVIIPLLTLVFGVDIRYAIGASLVSVIATSSGAAAAYVKKGFSNIRLGMFLEMATTFGALFGAAIAARISTQAIAVIFGIVLLYSAFVSVQGHTPGTAVTEDTRHFLPSSLHLDAAYPGFDRSRFVSRESHPDRFQPDVFGRHAFRTARDRLRRRKGISHGPGHERSLQSFHNHQQLHDRRHCRCKRQCLSQSRLYRSRIGHACHARGCFGVHSRLEDPHYFEDTAAPNYFCRDHFDPGFGDDLQRHCGKALAMNDKKLMLSDADIDQIIGNLLRIGVVVSSLIVLIGGGLYLRRHGNELPNYHIFYGEPSELRNVFGIIKTAFSYSGRGIIQFGLLLLIATPGH